MFIKISNKLHAQCYSVIGFCRLDLIQNALNWIWFKRVLTYAPSMAGSRKLKIWNIFHSKCFRTFLQRSMTLDLLNLAKNGHRFENIAKSVVKKRYTHKYFAARAPEPEYGRGVYQEFIKIFGHEIKAIDIEDLNFRCNNIL